MHEISEDMITEAADGDINAFEQIYKKTSGFVYNVALRLAGNKHDAEEITQDVFITIHKKLSGYRFESSLKTWIYRITYNLSINYLKKRSKERHRNISYDDAMANPETNLEAIEAKTDKIEEDEEGHIEKMLSELNPDQKACIILRSLEGLSYREIAEALKININTVRSRIKRAREALLAFRKNEATECEA